MSWQEGDGPDPTEVSGPLNPAAEADYLSAAAGHLQTAEAAYMVWSDFRATGQDRIDARATVTAAGRLAELNARMAEVCGAYQDRQPRIEVAAPPPADVDAMAAAIGEQLAADTAAHEAVTLRPGVDDEPVAEGELWTPTDEDQGSSELFWYAMHGIPDHESEQGQGYERACRWLRVKHYAAVLRWQTDRAQPLFRWDAIPSVPLRRPTAEERARFYGPEPDPQPAVMEQHERTTTIPDNAPTPPEAACHQFVALEGVRPATTTLCERCGASAEAHLLKMFGPRQGGILARQIRAAEQISEGLNPAPRGGAAQWREG